MRENRSGSTVIMIAILACVIIFVSIGIIFIFLKKDGQTTISNTSEQISPISSSQSAQNTTSVLTDPKTIPPIHERLIIKQKFQDKIVFEFDPLVEKTLNPENSLPTIAYWNNFFIYKQHIPENSSDQVIAYDLVKNTKKTLFSSVSGFSTNSTFKGECSQLSVINLRVLKDILLVELAKPDCPHKLYWVDLQTFNFGGELNGDRIEEYNEKYYLLSSLNNECGGTQTYTIINPQTMEEGRQFKSDIGCSDGYELLGFDSKNNPIYAFHRQDSGITLYTNIFAKEQGKEPLIDLGTLPSKNIYLVTLLPIANQVLLFFEGETLALDLLTKKAYAVSLTGLKRGIKFKSLYEPCFELTNTISNGDTQYGVINQESLTFNSDSSCDPNYKNDLDAKEFLQNFLQENNLNYLALTQE